MHVYARGYGIANCRLLDCLVRCCKHWCLLLGLYLDSGNAGSRAQADLRIGSSRRSSTFLQGRQIILTVGGGGGGGVHLCDFCESAASLNCSLAGGPVFS